MPPIPKKPCVLICGEDDFGVKQRAKEIFSAWTAEIGGMDHDVIDASASNSGEALKALAKLRESLQTLPFFGGGKVVWLQNCNFLGDERTASAAAVTETLAQLSKELAAFKWENVRLLISAGKVDKRKAFYKNIDKIGEVEMFAGWLVDDRNWAALAEDHAARVLRDLKKEISHETLSLLVNNVGPNPRALSSEIEKLALYVGNRPKITARDVETIVTRNKQARAFALGDALGDRDLPRLLHCLDEELWEAKRDSQHSAIGLLYGLITKIRVLIFLKSMLAQKILQPESNYSRFQAQLTNVPADILPEDKKINPLSMNPYVLFKALSQVRNYSLSELIQAMDTLLRCNLRLVSSSLDDTLVLQEALIHIVSKKSG